MTVDQDEPVESIEYSGNFTTDFHDACRRHGCHPLKLLKIGTPLPPLPIPLTPRPRSAALSGPDPVNTNTINELDADTEQQAEDGAVGEGEKQEKQMKEMKEEVVTRAMSYHSRYQYTPTVLMETGEGEEEEELQKVEIRGWKVQKEIVEVLAAIVPAAGTISQLVFWNCGLTASHMPFLSSSLLLGSLRSLSLDQNPQIPDLLFADLVAEESQIRYLSLRSNEIGDAGAKALAEQLKTNRTLVSLNLWDNNIEREGAEALAEALKVNQVLASLSLGSNRIGDDGAVAIAKALSNSLLPHDEIAIRRKAMELDKQRKEQEEDPIVKKQKGRALNSGGANGAPGGRNSSAKMGNRITSSENIINPPAGGVKKDAAAVDAKTKAKGKGVAAATKGATTAEAAASPPAAAVAKPNAGGATAAAAAKKGPVATVAASETALPASAAAGPKKGAAVTAVAATAAAAPPPADEKAAAKGAKGAKGAVAAKAGKKGKAEEVKEELEEIVQDAPPPLDPMFEHNGQWYISGNRTLNNLNLYGNDIREDGLTALLDAVQDQDATSEHSPDGCAGLFRITLLGNALDTGNPTYIQLMALLAARNPYSPQEDVEAPATTTLAADGGADNETTEVSTEDGAA